MLLKSGQVTEGKAEGVNAPEVEDDESTWDVVGLVEGMAEVAT